MPIGQATGEIPVGWYCNVPGEKNSEPNVLPLWAIRVVQNTTEKLADALAQVGFTRPVINSILAFFAFFVQRNLHFFSLPPQALAPSPQAAHTRGPVGRLGVYEDPVAAQLIPAGLKHHRRIQNDRDGLGGRLSFSNFLPDLLMYPRMKYSRSTIHPRVVKKTNPKATFCTNQSLRPGPSAA